MPTHLKPPHAAAGSCATSTPSATWHAQCPQCPKCCPACRPRTPHCWQELKRKLEAAEDSDIVEQGKATLKSVKKELRLLQKAEEEHDQGESARSSPL